VQVRNTTKIITTPEKIVRDFRELDYNTYEAAKTMRPLFRPVRRPFFLIRWARAINWNFKFFEWACWAAVIVCLVYLGIFVFAPFFRMVLA